MRKILSSIISICITACLLCACGSAVSDSSNVAEASGNKPTGNNEVVSDNGLEAGSKSKKDDSYISNYMEVIDTLYKEGSADMFALIYVDEDDIPELAAASSEGLWDKDQIFLYTSSDHGAVLVASDIAPGMEGHSISFIEGKNIIIQSGAAAGERYIFYGIEDTQPVELLDVSCSYMLDESGEEIVICNVNDKDATEQEYVDALKDFLEPYESMIMLQTVSSQDMVEMSVSMENGYFATEETGTIPYSTYVEILDELMTLMK
ncbi:MAG: hypothetical protein K6A23_11525 [Butyrivibrio sp.]|nr:hypothetical protein [Butyrivibrio sp.]